MTEILSFAAGVGLTVANYEGGLKIAFDWAVAEYKAWRAKP